MKLNTEEIMKPYIDADFYTNVFKPNKNAMIIGSFNNVDAHVADFDPFRNRASELADRLLNNKVTEAGGIEFVSPTPQMFIRKGAAAIVQWWYINGYNVSDIDDMLSLGSLNMGQKVDGSKFRKIIGLDALLLLQKSGMWDKRVFAYDVTKKLKDLGIDTADILLMSDALAIFQQKNMYDDNFHVDIDYSSELSGQAIDRWIKVVETTKRFVSFNITGGSDLENARALLFIDRDDLSTGQSDAYIYSTKLVTNEQKPSYYAKNVDGVLSIYVKVDDSTPADEAHLLISDIYADDAGEYQLFGSQTTDDAITEISKANVLQSADIAILEQRIEQAEKDIATLSAEVAQVQANKDAIAILQKDVTANKSKITALTNQQNANTAQITANVANIASNLASITALETSILKKDGSVQIDPTFTPVNDYDIVYLKVIKDLETKLRADFNTLSGYETEWEGSEGLTNQDAGVTTHVQVDVSPLVPQTGVAFEYINKKKITITFETSESEDTVDTRIGNDGKWDTITTIHDAVRAVNTVQCKLDVNGILTVRNIDENGNEVAIPNGGITLVAIYQITGNVYTTDNVIVDDTEIQSLEGVNI